MIQAIRKRLIKFSILLFTITLYSCFLFPKPKDISKTGQAGELVGESRLTSNDLKEGATRKDVTGGSGIMRNLSWAKSGDPKPIRDNDNKVIHVLDGNIRYSYIFSPIKMDGLVGTMPIASVIVFETTATGDSKYKVKELNLMTAGHNLDFNEAWGRGYIPLKDNSEDKPDYVSAYNFGVLNVDLNKAFATLFDPSTRRWNYMLAILTVQNMITGQEENYTISLNPELYNDTIRLILEKYPDIMTAGSNEEWTVPVPDAPAP